MEVAVQNGSAVGKQEKAAKLEELAARIDEKHRAHDATVKSALRQMSTALDHALDAGDLLLEAKKLCPHKTWKPWVRANCEVSVRRAEEYMYMAERRDKILEESKARNGAFSSIRAALDFLRRTRYTGGGWFQQESELPTPQAERELTPAEIKRQRAKERAEARKEQGLLRKAEYALHTGNYDPPDDLTDWEFKNWQGGLHDALTVREENTQNILETFSHVLATLVKHVEPEAVGMYLANECRGEIPKFVEGEAWLQRVLVEAEGHVRQRARYDEAPKLGEEHVLEGAEQEQGR